MVMRSKMAKLGTSTWRLWLGLGLVALATLSAVLSVSIGSTAMLIFIALSVLLAMVGLVHFSLWSKLRGSWL
jgi:hypothetical protein